jgi:hypothetical protein
MNKGSLRPAVPELVARLEAATEGSRELDGLIATLFGWVFETRIPEFRSPKWWPPGPLAMKDRTSAYAYAKAYPPSVTTSLDAALALAERLWPHVMWRIGHDPDDGSFKAELVTAQKPGDPPPVSANGATPALALCIAILNATEKDHD